MSTTASNTANTKRKELALIHVAKHDLVKAGRMSDDSYRLAVESVLIDRGLDYDPDKPSSARLDGAGRRQLIRLMKERFGWTGDNRAPVKKRDSRYHGRGEKGMGRWLTQGQADKIARLEDALGWTSQPKRLIGFIERQIRVRATVEMLSVTNASKVILGLEQMKNSASAPTNTVDE